LALALGFFAFDKFVLDPQREAAIQQQTAAQLASATENARKDGRTEALVESFGDKSIAVLPFANMSSDAEQEYFSDGISEEVLNLLAKIPELRVISRQSSFSFKGQNIEIGDIAERLNVAHVLEGSVRKSGNQVRITARLVDARADTELWSDQWERTLDDIFAIQDEIAVDVVDVLQLTLLKPIPKSRRTNPETFALTMKADQLLELRVPALANRAAVLLDRALALDEKYLPALHLVIRVNYLREAAGMITEEEEMRLWERLKVRILAIDPDDVVVQAYSAYSAAFESDRDLETALAGYQKAVERAPYNSEVLRQAGAVARRTGFFEQSVRLLERASELDPLCINCLWNLKETYLAAARLDDAERTELKYQDLGGNRGSHYGLLKLMQGDPSAAMSVYESFTPGDRQRDAGIALAQHDLGNEDEFNEMLKNLIEDWGDDDPELIASVFAYTGDLDAAFEWLEITYMKDEDGLFKEVFKPFWRNLHGDPRWDELRERLRMSVERLAAIEFDINLPDYGPHDRRSEQ
jgi:adenylate cyclase